MKKHKKFLFLLSMTILVVTLIGCANPTSSSADPDDHEPDDYEPDLLKEVVLLEDQTFAFERGDDLYRVGLINFGGGSADVRIQDGTSSEEVTLNSRQPKEVFGLWWMTTWFANEEGMVGLIVSDQRPPSDYTGPPIPGDFETPTSGTDPHSYSYYEESDNQETSGSVEPYDYSYGSNNAPGDTITITVKLDATSSGNRLLRVALGGDSSIQEVEVPSGNSIHEIQLDIPDGMSSGWTKFRITIMTEGGSILYNSDEDYWIDIR